MINFIDEKGVKHSAIVECKKTKGVNGEKSLSGTIYTNDEILEGIGRGWRLEFENEKYCLTYVYPIDEGNRIVVEFDAVHEFFFDLNKKVVYSELNGSNTAKAYLDLIFNGSGYSYVIEVNIPAFEKEGFGMRNRLDLFKEFISDTGVEFSVNGKVVRILEKVGSNLSTVVKKGFNLNELRIEKDPGSFITYKKGFGAWVDEDDHSKGRLEVEYLSPLASIYGKLEGDPIVDERYKVASNFETRLKNDVESSYGISVDIDMEDLTKAGYEYEQPHEGDYIMAINKDLGFEQKIRIMSYETSYDTNGNIVEHKVSCGSDNIIRKSNKEDDDFRKEIQAGLEGAVSTSNKAWVSANGKNAVFEGPDEPTATAIGDTWFQIDGEEKIMRIWNGYEWKPVFNPGEIEKKVEQAEQEVQTAVDQSNDAVTKANQAVEDAGFAKDQAETATTLAQNANQSAQDAVSQSSQAHQLAVQSATDASGALNTANGLLGRVEDAEGTITNINSSIDDITGELEHKVSQTDYDTLTGRVDTAEGSITANATAITQRATKSSVDTLTGRVSTAEGQISTQAGQIANRLTASEVNSLVDGKGYATQASVNSQVSRIDGDINSWNSQLQSIDAKVDGLEIGGRNLVGDFNTTEGYYLSSASGELVVGRGNTVSDFINVYQAKYVTLSKYVLSNISTRLGRVITYDENQTFLSNVYNQINASTGWDNSNNQVIVVPENAYYIRVSFPELEVSAKYKLEKGNKATDWSPAPEDLATVTALTTSVNQINQTITDTNNSIQLLTQTVTQNGEDISSVSADLTVADGKITGLTSKTDGHTTQIGNLQSGYDGLQSTVATVQSDLDGKVSTTVFSDYQQTVQGFQTTVNSQLGTKADKSQITQLSGQITSVVTDVSKRVMDYRYYTTSTSNEHASKWFRILRSTIGSRYHDATLGLNIIGTGSGDSVVRSADLFVRIKQQAAMGSVPTVELGLLDLSAFNTDDFIAVLRANSSTQTVVDVYIRNRWSYTFLSVEPYNVLYPERWQFIDGETPQSSPPSGTRWYATRRGNLADIYGAQSQITQLSDQINLRVTKNDVINQINVSTEGILIAGNKVRITGQTSIDNGVIKRAMIGDLEVSGAKIADATISSGKIISLDAGKITAGMINTSNITIGTATSGKRVNITGAGLIAHDSNGRLRVKLGVQDLAGDGQSDPSTLVFYTGNGTRSASIGTNTNDTFVIGTEQSNVYTLIRTPTQLTLESSSVRVNSPAVANNNYWNFTNLNIGGTQHPNIRANVAGTGTIGTANSYRLRKIYTVELDSQYLSVGVGDTTVAADFNTGADSNGGRIWSVATYNRTYSGSANMFITTAGTFGRITSARKYKMDIQVADHAINNAKKILQINPVSWIDKSAFLNGKSKHRYHGFIADDFHDLGLNEVVIYGSDGQVESLAYDRISMYHNVILNEHEQQITQLQQSFNSNLQQQMQFDSRLMTMSKEIAELKAELTLLKSA